MQPTRGTLPPLLLTLQPLKAPRGAPQCLVLTVQAPVSPWATLLPLSPLYDLQKLAHKEILPPKGAVDGLNLL